jgi:hypothetical protein
MSYYEDGPDYNEVDLPISIDGPKWYVTYKDVNTEGHPEVVIGVFHERRSLRESMNTTLMRSLQDEGHDLHIKDGYAWSINGEDHPGLGRFALSEEDAISDADSLLNERLFWDTAARLEDAMDEERWARGK